MINYFARKEYEYTGGDAIFSIPFDYIKKEHINVYINDEATENYTYLTASQIQISDTLETGDIVTIVRNTPINNKMVTFSDTSILNKDVQNLAQDQLFKAVQEIYDDEEQFKSKINETIEQVNEAAARINELDEDIAHVDAVAGEVDGKLLSATQAATRAENAANSASIPHVQQLSVSDWTSIGNGRYTCTIPSVACVIGVYKIVDGKRVYIININEEISSDSTLLLTSLEPVDCKVFFFQTV